MKLAPPRLSVQLGRLVWLFSLALVGVSAAQLPAGRTDLIAEAGAWKTAVPFAPAGLKFAAAPLMKVSSHGHARDVGGWMRTLPTLAAGKRYRFEVSCSVEGLEHPQRHVWALLTTGGREYLEFIIAERVGPRLRLTLEFSPVKDLTNAELRLYLADTPGGAVTWETATAEDITAGYRPRMARLAAISGKPDNPKTPAEAVEFYARQLDQVAGRGIDLVCLPENINVDEVPGDRWAMLEPIPGPTTRRLGEKARQHRVYIVASLAERAGEVRYNTAVLIDRQGEIVATYRKSHLTVNEHLLSGITEGGEFVVHQADFGKVGLMVCWDQHFPEVARILALKGAEVLALPNAADAREKGTLWESAMRMRAVDNHVAITSAVNFGRSLIVAPDGTILAKNERVDKEPGGMVLADCELTDSVANYSGQGINKRYLQVRRPEIYEALLGDFGGDLKAEKK